MVLFKRICWLVVFFIFVSHVLAQDTGASATASKAPEPLPRLSLDINGMELVDALRMFGEKVGENLVIDKNVSGRVTVFLKDVLPEKALDMILASNGCVSVREEGITRVMTAENYEKSFGVRPDDPVHSGRVTLVTKVFSLNYAAAEKVAAALRDTLSRGVGSLQTDTRLNKLIITDTSEKIEKACRIIQAMDDRTREVAIDAKIVQVHLSDKTSLGIDWEYVLNKKVSVREMFGPMVTTTGQVWTIGRLDPEDPNDYRAIIDALQTQGETKILSSPRLTVVHNESAKILVGSKQVYVTTSAVQSASSTETAEAVNFVDVGVKLFVTPMISADGFISLKVRPEVSSVVKTYKTAAGNAIPVVETSEAETTVLLRDGQTIVIAGLMKDEKSRTVNRVPWMGRLPLVGFLFRNTADETVKTELVVFLTCRIVAFDRPHETIEK
jgi:type II secretory pathway component GspD/PulD (secretin)